MHPELFRIGNFTVRIYGLMYVVAIVVGILLTKREVDRKGLRLKLDDILDFVLVAIPLGIIGARLYYVAFQWGQFQDDPLRIVYIWEGGLAIHGGLIGGAVALLIFAKWKRISSWRFADALAPSIILGQAIGRFGNFMNGDAYGTCTTLPWGLKFALNTPAHSYLLRECPAATLHPAMLYELIGNLIIFGLIWWWLKKRDYKDGFVISFYFIAYSLLRFAVEFFRGDALMVGEVRVAQAISVLIIAILGWFILYYGLYQKREIKRRRGEA